MIPWKHSVLVITALGVLAVAAPEVPAQHAGHTTAAPGASAPGPSVPRRYTMEELHQSGGVPRGWKFTLPTGDAVKGRELFHQLGCPACHAIRGEGAAPSAGAAKSIGPELTGVGNHHPAEYFAESIIAPNAVIVDGPGFTGADGRAIMPSFAGSLSVVQLFDLVAYLKSLTSDEGHMHGSAAMERAAGDYVVRLAYAAGGRLTVFVLSRERGEPVPYLPVTATLRGEGMKPRVVKLLPMIGAEGFHYGASIAVPDETEQVTVALGRPTLQVLPSVKGRFAKPVTVEFDWEGP